MLLVSLVPVAVLLGGQLRRQLLEDGADQLLLSGLVVGVAGPDGDLDGVPPYRVGDAADVVVEGCLALALLL